MTNNGGSGSAAAAAADEPAFPALILDGLHRHLGKLRQATTQFAAAPTEVLTWTQSQPLHDAIALLLQVGWVGGQRFVRADWMGWGCGM